MNNKSRQPRNASRRGSTYVTVLGVAMAVTAIGLGSVSVSRVQTRSTTQANQWAQAKMLAISACEHAMTQMNNTDEWRANLNGVTVQRALGSGSFTWRVIDPVDGDLADTDSDPATLIATGTVGEATYSLTTKLSTPGQSQGVAGVNTTIWGVNEDDGMLFSIADYTDNDMGVTTYGPLYWNDSGTNRLVGSQIRGFAIDSDGVAYMVCGGVIGSTAAPVLARFSISTASSVADNVVEIVGTIDWPHGMITGLAVDPTDGGLYAIGQAGGLDTADHLLHINKYTAQITEDIGAMENAGGDMVGQGEGMAFDGGGALYVTDMKNTSLHEIDKAAGEITQVVDNDTVSTGKLQAMAWDVVNNRLIAVYDQASRIYHITLSNGNNNVYDGLALSGLNDVEGISFVPPGIATSTVRAARSPDAVNRKVD